MKSSRVDKLQVELNSQRERLEEATRLAAKLKVRVHKHTSVSVGSEISLLHQRALN